MHLNSIPKQRVCDWLRTQKTTEFIDVEWLPLSMFSLQSHFTLVFSGLVLDVNIVRDCMTVTRIGDNEGHRKVKFYSDSEFELFLKMELRRRLRNKPPNGQ